MVIAGGEAVNKSILHFEERGTGREPPSFRICSRNSMFLEHIQISEKIRM